MDAEKGHIGHSVLKVQDKGLFFVSFACLGGFSPSVCFVCLFCCFLLLFGLFFQFWFVVVIVVVFCFVLFCFLFCF